MFKKILRWLALAVVGVLALVTAMTVTPAAAQEQEQARKLKTRVDPVYPTLARKMNLGGSVKVQVTIAANGTIKTAKAIGGHPVLIDSAVDAVKRWKYEPGAEDTVTVVEFKFTPGA